MHEVEGRGSGALAELGHQVEGQVLLPGSAGYEAARRPAIARFHGVRPRAVVRCASVADLAATLRAARAAGLPVAVRSGGHCFAGQSSSEGGVVIDVTPLNAVTVDGGQVTAGAGTRLGELYDALDRHGVTLPAGCGPTVGIAGLTLGGGLGILGRTYGLTCDSLRAAEVVLADGRVVGCDERREPDLFWALRGGGTLGVVTSLVFDTVPAPDATGFHLTWPHRRATGVIEAWQGWAPDAPDALAASLVVSTAADPDRPPVISVFGAYMGGEAAGAALLAELADRVGEGPATAAYHPGPYRDVKRYLSTLDVHGLGGEPAGEDEGLMFQKSEYFARTLPPDAVAALVEHLVADRVPGQERELDFSPWGGAYTRVPGDATAFPHRSERFLLKHATVVAGPAGVEAGRRWLERSWALTHPHGTGGVYPNFPDPDLADPDLACYGANRHRLDQVRAAYDPDRVFGGQ
ncbi:MAG: FAD-binding protein [Mycobacteriales bacterium]